MVVQEKSATDDVLRRKWHDLLHAWGRGRQPRLQTGKKIKSIQCLGRYHKIQLVARRCTPQRATDTAVKFEI